MKNILTVAVVVLILSRPVDSALLTPGATLSPSVIENGYLLSANNGLDLLDINYSAAVIGMLVSTSGSSWTLQSDFATLTPGHMWYKLSPGAILDPSYVSNATVSFCNAMQPHFDHVLEKSITIGLNQPFYLGGWISVQSFSPMKGDVYAWAKLNWNGSTLQLLDSAADTDRGGIVIGQYQQVPEPATVLLFGLGGVGAWFLRRNARDTEE